MPSITQVSVPVTMLVGMAAGLWVIFQQYSTLNGAIDSLQNTHDRFEYEVKINRAEDQLLRLDNIGMANLTPEQKRLYDRLKKAVERYEAEVEKLL